MNFPGLDILCCPIDQMPLAQRGSSLVCSQGHAFDIARLGYVNLLGAGDKRSREPGDSKDMVLARREFLEGGHYQAVAERLTEVALPHLGSEPVIVDAGCGEGYYLQQLVGGLPESATVVGFDISKWAVQAATRRFKGCWLVASNRNIPLVPGCADLLLSLFGFPVYDAFHRVLKDGGLLLLASAGPAHLIELREIIYPRVRSADSTELQQAQAVGFSVLESQLFRYRTSRLEQLDIARLLRMTPHFFRASAAGRREAEALNGLALTVEVQFHLLRAGPPQ